MWTHKHACTAVSCKVEPRFPNSSLSSLSLCLTHTHALSLSLSLSLSLARAHARTSPRARVRTTVNHSYPLHAACIKLHVASAAFLASRHARKDALAITSASLCGLPQLPKASNGDKKGWTHVGGLPEGPHPFLTLPCDTQHAAVFCTQFLEVIVGFRPFDLFIQASAVGFIMASNIRVDDDQSGSFRMSDSLAPGKSSKTSLLSKIDSAGHRVLQTSMLRDDRMLGHAVEKLSREQAEPVEHLKPKQGALMRKLSWLMNPKKKPPKSSLRKRTPSSIQEGGSDAKDHLELLFAQAEETLGELLVRAGTSFNARSRPQEDHYPHPHHHHHHHHERARSNGGLDSTSVRLGGSFGRSSTFAGQGHARRNSLSRVWQQLGGSLFCGSGHMNALVMEEMELRGMAPLPQAPAATYFGDGVDDDMVIDESYWQSLAENILMERQKMSDVDQHAIHHLDEQNEQSNKDKMAETSRDYSDSSANQQTGIASREREADCVVSEIMSVPSDADLQGRQEEDVCRWAACGMAECSLEDSHTELLVDGCTRLNTTLDASPNLAHNYQLHMKSGAGSGGVTSSSSKSAVELLNHFSRPLLARTSDQVVEPSLALVAASSSGAAYASVEATVQPFDEFLSHAHGRWSEPSLDSPSNAVASGTATSSLDSRAEQPPESANCTRVSLMTLLHEETAAVENVDAAAVVEEVGHAQAGAPQEEEKSVGEEPLALLCCVCMVRRKGAALIPCGHTFCRICSKQLFAGRGACPLCNNLIVQLLDIF